MCMRTRFGASNTFFIFMLRRPPGSTPERTLFPYPTLFRSMADSYLINENPNFSENETDQIIRVQRVPEASGPFYFNEENTDYTAEETNDFFEQESEPRSPSIRTEPGLERNNTEFVQEEPIRELLPSETVVTLYYSDNETTPFNNGSSCEINGPAECTLNPSQRRFRLTPAASSMVGKQLRGKSAPPAHLTDFQEFKGSREFIQLETAYSNSEELIYKNNRKLDLDSVDGYNAGKQFLDSIEVLVKSLLIPCKDRKYRQKFSQAYKILYKENSLCYLTEILNAAQESYSYIIVNSEKYIFSPNVLQTGNKLYNSFENLRYLIKDICNLY